MCVDLGKCAQIKVNVHRFNWIYMCRIS